MSIPILILSLTLLGTILALVYLGVRWTQFMGQYLEQSNAFLQKNSIELVGAVERITANTVEVLKATSLAEKAQADAMRDVNRVEVSRLQSELSKSAALISSTPELKHEAEIRAQQAGLKQGAIIIRDKDTGQERRLEPML